MSKSMNRKKDAKKKPVKTASEKRAEKRATNTVADLRETSKKPKGR